MIGVIADDLTGAAEIGAVGVRHGLRAEIVMSGQVSSKAGLVCVDTDSRSRTSEEAGRRAVYAASLLHKAGARWIYKKTDSVLRGQVTAELEAMMKELRLPLALLVPANPSLGRTIRDGRYFVGGKPIYETEFARDPEHPRTSSDVRDMLGDSKLFPVSMCGIRDSMPASGIVVGEAVMQGDLRHWAAHWKSEMLPAGGAEFFGALLQAHDSEGRVTRVPNQKNADEHGALATHPSGNELFVCGSASESAREFANAAGKRGTPVFSLPETLARSGEFAFVVRKTIAREAVAALLSHRRVILNVGLPPVQEQAAAAGLAIHLVHLAENVLRQAKVGHIYAEGGATAVELVRRMGWSRLSVVRELSPGVATLAVEGKTSLLLTIKPGSYVWPDAIRNAI